jgi:hypothetical protein
MPLITVMFKHTNKFSSCGCKVFKFLNHQTPICFTSAQSFMVEFMTSHRQNRATKTYINLAALIRENGGVECEQVPEVFYPEDSPYATEQRMSRDLAKEICNRCPIRNPCADFAISTNEAYGIWGGLTPGEREQLRKK